MVIDLRNIGNQEANNISLKLRSGDARFVISESVASYGNIPAGASQNNALDPFVASVSSQIPLETTVLITALVSGDSYCDTLFRTVVIGQIRTCDPIPDGPREPARYWAYDDADSLYAEHPSFDWVELRGRGTQVSLYDDQTIQVNLPSGFVWKYYGQSYGQISVCSNGWVAAGYTTNIDYTNGALPYTGMPPMVALNWDDLYPPVGNGVWYFHDAANHRFVVEFDSVAYFSPQTTCDKFELVIYDTTVATPTGDNVLVAQYLTANNYTANTVGLQDPNALIGIQCLFDGNYHRGCAPLIANRAVKYTTTVPATGVAEPVSGPRPLTPGLRAAPNPFRGLVALELPANAALTALGIYDNAGRLVRSLPISAGMGATTWNGCDETGARVAPGIYFYRATSAQGEVSGKLILSR